MNHTHTEPDFAQLAPDSIISTIESLGMRCDARIYPLNSYENRVYQIGIEDQQPVIAKFYRPNRWTDEQILEEHYFTEELEQLDIPVVAPLRINGQTLIHAQSYRLALYPRRGGRVAELDNLEHLAWISRFMGRIHAVGSVKKFKLRPDISIQAYAVEPSRYLLANDFIPDYLQNAYQTLAEDILKLLKQRFDASTYRYIRLHGDCHAGNILWTDKGPHFVDFDDSRNGPAIQDLWMMLSGEHNDQQQQLHHILDSYSEFYDFNPAEIALIEPLRTLRIIHYAGWLAQRWQDPAFPFSFPWFNTSHYWEQHILELREQFALLQENEEFSA